MVNLKGEHPATRTVENYYKAFSRKAGRRKNKYANCGRKAWKLTKETQKFVIKRLKQLRRDTVGRAKYVHDCAAIAWMLACMRAHLRACMRVACVSVIMFSVRPALLQPCSRCLRARRACGWTSPRCARP